MWRNPISESRLRILRQQLVSLQKQLQSGKLKVAVVGPLQEFYEKNLELVGDADPTASGKYCSWILRQWYTDQLELPEDSVKIREILKVYHRVKPRLPQEHRQIKTIKNYQQLRRILEDYLPQTLSHSELIQEGTQFLLETPIDPKYYTHPATVEASYSIYMLTTPEAASKAAQNTGWCICDERTARNYLEDGPLYIIFMNTKKHFEFHNEIREETERIALLHLPSNQAMDINDRPLHPTSIGEKTYRSLCETLAKCGAETYSLELKTMICDAHGGILNLVCSNCSYEPEPKCAYCVPKVLICTDADCPNMACEAHAVICKECEKPFCDSCGYTEGEVCEEHAVRCEPCGNLYAPDLVRETTCCGVGRCENCSLPCGTCMDLICQNECASITTCFKCDEPAHKVCLERCDVCNEQYHGYHNPPCKDCSHATCPQCSVRCDICGEEPLCHDCAQSSEQCGCKECETVRNSYYETEYFCWEHHARECIGNIEEYCRELTHKKCESCDSNLCEEHAYHCKCGIVCEMCHFKDFCTVCKTHACIPDEHLGCPRRKRRRLRRRF